MTRPTFEEAAMETARAWAKRSTCLRRAVGCVLLDARGRVLATGYNGVASGLPHCNHAVRRMPKNLVDPTWKGEIVWDLPAYEPTVGGNDHLGSIEHPHACPGARAPSGTALDACGAVHAEQNAVSFCSNVDAVVSCVVTTSPCTSCVKLLLNTGCRRIVFDQEYPDMNARDLWQRSGRIWLSISSLSMGS